MSMLSLSLLNESRETITAVSQDDSLWCQSDPRASKTMDTVDNLSIPILPLSKMH